MCFSMRISCLFFFFKQKTAYEMRISDWSSDVCSSDLHIAFAVESREKQLEVRKALMETGYQVTPVIDRDYFWAIYFRTPGGVLFEVATNEPGFDRDEDRAHLGETLKLPAQHAHLRASLEQNLAPLAARGGKMDRSHDSYVDQDSIRTEEGRGRER